VLVFFFLVVDPYTQQGQLYFNCILKYTSIHAVLINTHKKRSFVL